MGNYQVYTPDWITSISSYHSHIYTCCNYRSMTSAYCSVNNSNSNSYFYFYFYFICTFRVFLMMSDILFQVVWWQCGNHVFDCCICIPNCVTISLAFVNWAHTLLKNNGINGMSHVCQNVLGVGNWNGHADTTRFSCPFLKTPDSVFWILSATCEPIACLANLMYAVCYI